MPNISITVKNKVARADRAIIVCDNSDYTAVFDFDDEWSAYGTKTARFVYGGKYTDVVFSGNECPVPVIQDTCAVTVGVFAGDLHTTTPAYFACVPSILFGGGVPADPTPDVYNQIMEMLNNISLGGKPATTETLGLIKVGENLKITEDGVLSVDATAGYVPSVQPDWNQNDSTQPDYVKNRPFYTGDPVETVLVEESTVSFANAGGMYMAQLPSTFSATVGETYKVYWDGITYECTCVDHNGYPAIGNLSMLGAASDTGEPFIMAVNNGVEIQIVSADTSASHTFSISGFVPEVVKIDKKYLPEIGLLKEIKLNTAYADIVDIISAQSLPFIKLSDNYAHAILYLSGIRVNANKDTFMFSSEPILDNSGRYVFFTTYVDGNDKWSEIESNYMAKVDSESEALYLNSSTLYSTKKFRITVDDSGAITATEVS